MHDSVEGIRVLDLGTFIAGPHCATILGEFGAEVIKVEPPKTGDSLRRLAPSPNAATRWYGFRKGATRNA